MCLHSTCRLHLLLDSRPLLLYLLTSQWETSIFRITHLRQQTSIIQVALASSIALSSISATDADDVNISMRYGKQKSCCCHRNVIIRRATAASSVDDENSCLQVANTGPTATYRHDHNNIHDAISYHWFIQNHSQITNTTLQYSFVYRLVCLCVCNSDAKFLGNKAVVSCAIIACKTPAILAARA